MEADDGVWTPPPYTVPTGLDDPAYGPARTRAVTDILADAALLARFRDRLPLPNGFGAGLDERVVEYPWLLAHHHGGPALDAGSTLNHAHVLHRFLPALAPLTIATLRPEAEAFTSLGVSYLYADLRDLPLRDAQFTTVICASTLEHVGMDNALYGEGAGRSADPEREVGRALGELTRVAAPGGRILVTVPYGRAEDHGWFRQLDRAGVNAVAARLSVAEPASIALYAQTTAGWQLSSADAAAGSRYRDGVPGARAVACIRATVPDPGQGL
jgi:SAM-dependent methyltransferase